MKRLIVDVVTDGSGNATAYTSSTHGKVHSVNYLKDGTTPFTDGVDFTITTDKSAEGIWTEANVNASTVRYPRAPLHSQVGVALLYAASGTAVTDKVALANDRVKIAIAQGGANKLGRFLIHVDD